MAGKKPKPKPEAAPPAKTGPSITRPAFKVVATGLAVVLLVTLLATLGIWAGEQLTGRDRYAVRIVDLECEPPADVDKLTFLTEVRYLGNLPETIPAIDPEVPDRLKAAFVKHPWVSDVKAVTVGADRRIRVELRFRTAVVAIRIVGETVPRAVDKSGVLLPASANTAGLPELTTPQLPPLKPAGEVWDDPVVKRAAELADLYKPVKLERADKGWRITTADGKTLTVGI